jgi:hypothetical protein
LHWLREEQVNIPRKEQNTDDSPSGEEFSLSPRGLLNGRA